MNYSPPPTTLFDQTLSSPTDFRTKSLDSISDLPFASFFYVPGPLGPNMMGGDRSFPSDASRDMSHLVDGSSMQTTLSAHTLDLQWGGGYSSHAIPMTISPADMNVATQSIPPPPSPQLIPPILHHPTPFSPPLNITPALARMSLASPVPSSFPVAPYAISPLDAQPPMTPPSHPARLNNPIQGPGIPHTITVPVTEPYYQHESWGRTRGREQGYDANVVDSSADWAPPPPPLLPRARPSRVLVDSRYSQSAARPSDNFAVNHTINGDGRSRRRRRSSQARQFQCNGCARAFARKHDLERHARIHTGETPYTCVGCHAAYMRTDKRQNHWIKKSNCRILHCMRMGEEDYGPSGRSGKKGKTSKAALDPNGYYSLSSSSCGMTSKDRPQPY